MRSLARLVVAAVAVLGVSVAFAKDAPKTAPAKSAEQTKKPAVVAPASQGGLVAFKDPVTGQLRQPTAEELGALLRTATPPVSGAPQAGRRLANGGLAFNVDPSFDSYTIATKGADGTLVMSCVEGKEKAEKAIAAGAPAPVREAHDEK